MPVAIRASDVMDLVASLLNDSAKSVFSYSAQLPYLQSAYTQLGLILEGNNIPVTNNVTSSPLTVTTAMTDIGGSTGPALPSDLIVPTSLYERAAGVTEDFILMTQREFVPLTVTLTSALTYWTWINQVIKFIGTTGNREVKIEYVANGLGTITDQTTLINFFNGKDWLAFRTAALCARYIGENPTRATELDNDLITVESMMLGINIKAKQSMPVRRRPFMAGYKSRGN